ncbi:hypothetical protein HHI36_010781 [Cryptolaemus montrouzieri]|uniref:Uncharacterized protein n=1 Tax=Cryptolaemus montrouzieri TaxID=559131 RepID=A0ABD2MJS7_9CUCU
MPMKNNIKKNKIMMTNDTPSEEEKVTVCKQEEMVVTSYEYLGGVISNDGKIDREKKTKSIQNLQYNRKGGTKQTRNRRNYKELKNRQLNMFGHIKRMDLSRIVRKISEIGRETKRTRGKPRQHWLKEIEELGITRGLTAVKMRKMVKIEAHGKNG